MNTGLYTDNLADFARTDYLLYRTEINVPASVLVNGENLAGGLCGGAHTVKLGNRQSNRLFANNVMSACKAVYHKGLVNVVGGSHNNDVNRFVGKNCFVIFINEDAVCPGGLTSYLFNIVGACKGANVAFQYLGTMPGSLSAVAYNCNFFHNFHLKSKLNNMSVFYPYSGIFFSCRPCCQ